MRASISHSVSNSRHDSSPLLFGRRGDRRSLPSLTGVRERSAGKALVAIWHPGRCRVPLLPGTHASRRSTVAIFDPATVLLRRTGGLHHSVPGSIGAALHPIVSSHQRRPPQRGRTMTAPPGTGLRAPPAGAAPGSVNQASLEDALDEQGMADLPGNKNRTREIRISVFGLLKFCSFVGEVF